MSHEPLSAPPPAGPPPPPRLLKAILIGDASTGKTSFRQRFISGGFSPAYRATIGCDFLGRKWIAGEGNDEEVNLQVWDTAGQERFRSLAPAFYRSSDACILVYSLTSPNTPDSVARSIRSWFEEFAAKCPVSSDEEERRRFCWVCVGTKADEVTSDEHANAISDAVERTLEELLPRRSARSRPRRTEEGIKGRMRLPSVSVEVLPPPAKGERPRRKRLTKARINGVDVEVGPSAASAMGGGSVPHEAEQAAGTTSAAGGDDGGSTTDTDGESASGSTETTTPSTTTPPTVPFELHEPLPDLLLATSPPAAPEHFGRAGAPPAIWVGGPYGKKGRIMEREDVDEESLAPDHRRDGEEDEEAEEVRDERTEAEKFADEGVRHFRRTSAKTGEGVDEVFSYITRRILATRAAGNLSDEEHAGTPYQRDRRSASKPQDVIRVNERDADTSFGQKLKSACCS
ncbi:hypothetical protein Rhopal_005527-T1 [Rhodotorula paludigena]|uniref:Uncharacterized protein n=1 Tax=Rhodotorula paludigena TaxID=86838 RepID=A0AAV5GTX9_9BASI|nr:hypothetical protein Rhopal_005527-T1 [Rhodotorula paludigena]